MQVGHVSKARRGSATGTAGFSGEGADSVKCCG